MANQAKLKVNKVNAQGGPQLPKSRAKMHPPELTKTEWVELVPSGIALQSGLGRPVLILKTLDDTEVMPVWMHPLDAGVAVAELSDAAGLTPHAVTRKVLEKTGLRLERCSFIELVGHHQFIQLEFRSSNSTAHSSAEPQTIYVRADSAMSFCLQAKAKFFSTRSIMRASRTLQAELGELQQNLGNQLGQKNSELDFSSKKHPYMM